MSGALDSFSDIAMGLKLLKTDIRNPFGWVIVALMSFDGAIIFKSLYYPDCTLKQEVFGYTLNILGEIPILIVTILSINKFTAFNAYLSISCFSMSCMYKLFCVVKRARREPKEWGEIMAYIQRCLWGFLLGVPQHNTTFNHRKKHPRLFH